MIKKPQIDESSLLSRTAQGDQAAFKIIYEAYQSQVLTFANKYLKSRQRSEEVMQEVFLRLWNLKEKLNDINDLENYILTITRNKAFDTLRQQKRESRFVQAIADHDDVSENNTEEKVLLDDTRQLLEKGIALLPPQQKQVYQLCHQQGLKYEEAATELGISPQTVHSHMKLALKSLRSYMSQNTDLAVILIILKII
jgi:RNA polymerase sigma-70 factor (ECF subfamily)